MTVDTRTCGPTVEQHPRCALHGGRWVDRLGGCPTENVLEEVRWERTAQYARYGLNDDLEDGTGPDVHWLTPLARIGAKHVQRILRGQYEAYERAFGKPTWLHLVREELAEVAECDVPDRLRAELIQVAALCVSWVEKLDARKG